MYQYHNSIIYSSKTDFYTWLYNVSITFDLMNGYYWFDKRTHCGCVMTFVSGAETLITTGTSRARRRPPSRASTDGTCTASHVPSVRRTARGLRLYRNVYVSIPHACKTISIQWSRQMALRQRQYTTSLRSFYMGWWPRNSSFVKTNDWREKWQVGV